MCRSGWHYVVAAVGLAFFVFAISYGLYPKEPHLSGNADYQESPSDYSAGGAECRPSFPNIPLGRERAGKTEACEKAREEHRLQTNDLIQQRRAADAAEASAVFAFQQTRIAVWALSLGLFTLLAASAAAIFARNAAAASLAANDIATSEVSIKRPHFYPKVATIDITTTNNAIKWSSNIRFVNGSDIPAYISKYAFKTHKIIDHVRGLDSGGGYHHPIIVGAKDSFKFSPDVDWTIVGHKFESLRVVIGIKIRYKGLSNTIFEEEFWFSTKVYDRSPITSYEDDLSYGVLPQHKDGYKYELKFFSDTPGKTYED